MFIALRDWGRRVLKSKNGRESVVFNKIHNSPMDLRNKASYIMLQLTRLSQDHAQVMIVME